MKTHALVAKLTNVSRGNGLVFVNLKIEMGDTSTPDLTHQHIKFNKNKYL
jgi:hypothetical protein